MPKDAFAALVGGKPKGGAMPPEGDAEETEEKPEASGVADAEMEEASAVFDDALPMEQRAAALKEFVRLCTKGGY